LLLDLPIDKNLGFAWIIPYGELAQFQIGYKGYVQLALRSGRYAGMNAVKVNAEALGGFDQIGDPLIKWDQLDETKEAIGYAFAWRLTTGFTKVVYWPKKAVEAHAQKYSQAYRAKKKDSPWFGEFDKMALKTLITISLKRWGIMSVEDRFQLAFERDQSAAIDIDATPIYPDNETESAVMMSRPPRQRRQTSATSPKS
jgi:recombination protein RecT